MARYRFIHVGLMLVPLLFFRGKAFPVSVIQNDFLAWDVFLHLLWTIGPVFFVLSTISVMTQVWLSVSNLPEQRNPYVLYAWSNGGSFAALLTYPFIFEYIFDLSSQLQMWWAAYFVLMGLSVAGCFLIPLSSEVRPREKETPALDRKDVARWFLLSAGGVILFLSVTNIMTMAIAPFPLLWIIPLGIYLLAFVLNFKRVSWCPSWITRRIHLTIGLGMLFYLFLAMRSLPMAVKVLILVGMLFVLCMYCQNQLAQSRPAGNKNLTVFYLWVAFGGFAGGMMTTWLMPLVSQSVLEYVLGLTVIALAVKPTSGKNGGHLQTLMAMTVLIMALFLWPLGFAEKSFVGMVLLLALGGMVFNRLENAKNALASTMILLLLLTPSLEGIWSQKNYLYKKRNYYGICRIFDYGGVRVFMHGTTLHGVQRIGNGLASEPTSYYGPHSPVAQILEDKSFLAERVGIVGLGAGTLAVYGRRGQKMDFYELDPEVYRIANRFFTFTKESSATIAYFLGDARIALDRNPSVQYDILILDAFSGDAIPVHLLTREMMAKYRTHLNSEGILLFHVTNRYVKAGLIASRSALSEKGLFCYKSAEQIDRYELSSDWIAVTWSQSRFEKLLTEFHWKLMDAAVVARIRPWTDEYSNILTVIKADELRNSLTDLRALH